MEDNELRYRWIEMRAAKLWTDAGKPDGKDLEFWLAAGIEHDHGYKGQLCILCPGECPYQVEQPTNGGRHVALCTRPLDNRCSNRASNFNKP